MKILKVLKTLLFISMLSVVRNHFEGVPERRSPFIIIIIIIRRRRRWKEQKKNAAENLPLLISLLVVGQTRMKKNVFLTEPKKEKKKNRHKKISRASREKKGHTQLRRNFKTFHLSHLLLVVPLKHFSMWMRALDYLPPPGTKNSPLKRRFQPRSGNVCLGDLNSYEIGRIEKRSLPENVS